MTEYWFYHLEASTLEGVLPGLLDKTRERGWQSLVKVPENRLAELDDYLWTYKDDAFLPHGRDDEPLSDNQPILLSSAANDSGAAQCVFLIDGTRLEVGPKVERCMVMINGRSDEAVQAAREFWKELKTTDATISYWQQNDRGGWEKKA